MNHHAPFLGSVFEIQFNLGGLLPSPWRTSIKLLSNKGSLVVEKSYLQCRRCGFDPWVRKIPWRKKMATHSSILA